MTLFSFVQILFTKERNNKILIQCFHQKHFKGYPFCLFCFSNQWHCNNSTSTGNVNFCIFKSQIMYWLFFSLFKYSLQKKEITNILFNVLIKDIFKGIIKSVHWWMSEFQIWTSFVEIRYLINLYKARSLLTIIHNLFPVDSSRGMKVFFTPNIEAAHCLKIGYQSFSTLELCCMFCWGHRAN